MDTPIDEQQTPPQPSKQETLSFNKVQKPATTNGGKPLAFHGAPHGRQCGPIHLVLLVVFLARHRPDHPRPSQTRARPVVPSCTGGADVKADRELPRVTQLHSQLTTSSLRRFRGDGAIVDCQALQHNLLLHSGTAQQQHTAAQQNSITPAQHNSSTHCGGCLAAVLQRLLGRVYKNTSPGSQPLRYPYPDEEPLLRPRTPHR